MLGKSKKLCLMLCLNMVFLYGCSDSGEVSEENFKKAIQAYLEKDKACLGLKASYIDNGSFGELVDFNELVKVGLLKKETRKPKSAMMRNITPTIFYTLTEEGKKIAKREEGFLGDVVYLCYGDKVVDEITVFTPPTVDGRGDTVSRVNYTYKIVNVADWAKNEAIQKHFDGLKEDLASTDAPLKGKATLILTNNGWVHYKLIR